MYNVVVNARKQMVCYVQNRGGLTWNSQGRPLWEIRFNKVLMLKKQNKYRILLR